MIIVSSLPLASQRPECAHLTHNTGPVCMPKVHSDFGGRPASSEAWLRMGLVLHIRTFASMPPVAIREPSGCTWQEYIVPRPRSPLLIESARRSMSDVPLRANCHIPW